MEGFACDGGLMEGPPLTQRHISGEGTLAMAANLSDPAVRRGESDPFELIELRLSTASKSKRKVEDDRHAP